MNERIKKLRKTLDLTQKDFGARIGVKGNTIAQYEMGRNVPIDSVLNLICREFRVNKDWLVAGKGEIFLPAPTAALDRLAEERSLSNADYIFIEKYVNMTPERRAIMIECILEIANSIISAESEVGVSASAPAFPTSTEEIVTLSDEDADALGRAYAEELKKKRDSMGGSRASSENA